MHGFSNISQRMNVFCFRYFNRTQIRCIKKRPFSSFHRFISFFWLFISLNSLWLALKIAVLRMKVMANEHVRKVSLHRLVNLEAYKAEGSRHLFTTWSCSKAKLQVFYQYWLANSPFRFFFLLLLSIYLYILFLQFVVNLKYWYLLHAQFESCPLLKTDICPFQKTAKLSVVLLTYYFNFPQYIQFNCC